jgi:hypothetical protein
MLFTTWNVDASKILSREEMSSVLKVADQLTHL